MQKCFIAFTNLWSKILIPLFETPCRDTMDVGSTHGNQKGYDSIAIETHLHETSLVFHVYVPSKKVLSLAVSQLKNLTTPLYIYFKGQPFHSLKSRRQIW